MERGKSGSGRGGKGKVSHFTQDLFALGTKSTTRVEASEAKRPATVHGKPSTSMGIPDRSRDQGSSSIAPIIPAKKPKVSSVSAILSRGVAGPPITPQPVGAEPWESVANEVDPADLVPQVLRAFDANQTEKVVGLLCGALKHVRSQRWKPDHCLVLSLMYIAKIRPSVLALDPVQQALCSLLKRDATQGLKNKSNPLVPILVTGLLLRAFNDSKKWPDVFLKLYLDDALNERVWVDMEECKGFVDNITTAFNTRQPPKSLLPQDMVGVTTSTGNPLMIGRDGAGGSGMASLCSSPSSNQGEDESMELSKEDSALSGLDLKEEFPVIPRYQHMQENVELIVTDFIKEHINRRQTAENTTRNFLRLLSATCGLVEVRQIASSRLEMWLQNPKLFKPAQELLICVCYNCITHSPQDIDVMCNILKIRLKTKTLMNLYLSGIGEMIRAHPDNLGTLLKQTIYNELSNSRNPNNMPMLSSMFQAAPTKAPVLLAWVFQELLMNREDYLRPLRALLREVVRILRHDLDMGAFCRELMSEARETDPVFQSFEFKDRMYIALVDLITLCIFLSISPAVKEAALAKGEKREIGTFQNYQMQVAQIQRDTIKWHHDVVLRMYRPPHPEFVHGIYKVLFMEPADVYGKIDMWPPEPERATLMHLASEVPLLQNTLMRIFIIGLSKEHPLNPVDALDFADQLVGRAASLPTEGLPMLEADKLKMIDLILNLCAYRHPETLSLPVGYVPPQLAITNSYWKAWTMLLLLSAHNPSTFGELAWQKYPTLRSLMEMCITNHFVYPPPLCQNPDELRAKELQSIALEKQQIIEFESHLAAVTSKVTITEANSLLLPQVMAMDPVGPMRRPPQTFLQHLRSLNQKYRLGHRLCRSRKPDFLLDIIQRHGTSHSMPWLADLVVNSEGSLSHLPVQCLCEFLLSSSIEKQPKHQQLLNHLRGVLLDPKLDPQAPCEILEYFLRRLSSTLMSSRSQAIKGLQLVLSSDDEAMDIDGSDREYGWLLRQLPRIPHFGVVRPQVVQALQQACQMENDPGLIAAYISFLALHTQDESLTQLTDLVVDMAQLIVERSTIMAALVPSNTESDSETLDCLMQIFCSFLQKTREPRKEQYTWSESQDEIRVTWNTNDESTMHILVVHAMVILLTYGPGQDKKSFEQLLEAWFPESREYPKAYLVDTSEEALLIPDWLKLKMIRSRVSRLVEAALADLEPPQLVLFIQSFGVPVESMSKLLHCLDQSVLLDEGAVADAVLDKNYMAQLVGVQHKRGATGGDVFVQVLQLYEQKLSDEVVAPPVTPRQVLPVSSPSLSSSNLLSPDDVYECLDVMFLVGDRSSELKALEKLQRALSVELTHTKADGPLMYRVTHYLKYQGTDPLGFVSDVRLFPVIVRPLFRLIFANEYVSAYSAFVTKNLLNFCQHVMRHDNPCQDEAVKAIARHYIQVCLGMPAVTAKPAPHSSQALVETVTLALLTHSPTDGTVVHTGKLIDKLVAMEPELIGSCPDLQMQLLFGRSAATLSCRPYLLTLLTHRASWATLHKVVTRLLSSTQPEFDPTAVLDFLWALTSNPKLWQGREKNTPKHYVPENVLCLPENQLLSMVGYIVEEASLDQGNQLESRLPQLLQCIQEDMHLVHKTVRHLLDVAASSQKDSPKSKMAEEFLLRLYFRIPGLIKYLMKVEIAPFLEKASVTEGGNSMLDRMSHLLFTALTATPPSGDWYKRSQEYELSARKMASVHPPLVLRQLPMLAASLRGRVHLDWGVFRNRNHLVLFQQTAGILELLQPYLFLKQHASALHAIFDSYFALFKHHGHAKDVVTLLGRIVNILQAYISRDGPRALQYLQTHALLLRDLQSRHPHLGSLCVLMSGVSLQRGVNCEVELEGGPEASENGPVIVAVAPPPPPQEIDWRPLLAQLEQAEGEDVVSTLSNLEHISLRQPSILQWFVEPLCTLLLSPTGSVRALSHTLLARYWRYDPSAAAGGVALRALTRCLDSNQPEVVATALERIPDIVLCVQEHAVPLLQKVFALGMCSSMNALSPLIKAIGLLNLQSGS